MKMVEVEEKYIFEYINDILNQSIGNPFYVENAKYHHSAKYDDAISIIEI